VLLAGLALLLQLLQFMHGRRVGAQQARAPRGDAVEQCALSGRP